MTGKRKISSILIGCLIVINSALLPAWAEGKITAEMMEDKVQFDYDERLFTLFALTNHTGYDFDNFDEFTDIRERLREDLEEIAPDLLDDEFYENYMGGSPMGLQTMFLPFVEEAPDFKVSNEMFNYEEISENLQHFYEEADIAKLYKKYKRDYEELIEEYEDDDIYENLAYVVNTLNIDYDDIKQHYIDINPLMSHSQGFTYAELEDPVRPDARILTVGLDYRGESSPVVIHEFMHYFTSNILESNRAEDLVEDIIDKFDLESNFTGYDGFSYIDECFVRTFETFCLDEDDMEDALENNAREFRFVDEIYENYIEEYDDFNDLEDFMIDCLEEILGEDSNGGNDGDYEEGYDDGYKDGYEKGKEKAEDKIDDAYDRGYEEGLEASKNISSIESIFDADLNISKMSSEYSRVSEDKVWTIKFNQNVDEETVNQNTVFVIDEDFNFLDLDFDIEDKVVTVTNSTQYGSGKYIMMIKNVIDKGSNPMSRAVMFKFEVE